MALLCLAAVAAGQTRPPAAWPDGANFAGVFTDHMVLQRAPERAAVYGVVVGDKVTGSRAPLPLRVTVTVEAANGTSYTVDAEHVEIVNGSYARWKALLKPAAAGGDYTISVECSGCSNSTRRSVSDVTFGDVWFCSGVWWWALGALFSLGATKATRN